MQGLYELQSWLHFQLTLQDGGWEGRPLRQLVISQVLAKISEIDNAHCNASLSEAGY